MMMQIPSLREALAAPVVAVGTVREDNFGNEYVYCKLDPETAVLPTDEGQPYSLLATNPGLVTTDISATLAFDSGAKQKVVVGAGMAVPTVLKPYFWCAHRGKFRVNLQGGPLALLTGGSVSAGQSLIHASDSVWTSVTAAPTTPATNQLLSAGIANADDDADALLHDFELNCEAIPTLDVDG